MSTAHSRLKSWIPRSRLAHATLMLSGATALAQGIGLAAAPVMTRLYSPDEYGSFFILNSISLVLAAGFALRLELAVPLPASDDEVRALVFIALGATTILSVTTLTVTSVWGAKLDALFGLHNGTQNLIFLAPLAASFAVYGVLSAVAIREARFKAIARRHLVLAALTVGFQTVAGLAGAGLTGLCLATVVGQVGGALSTLIGSPFFASGLKGRRSFPVKQTLFKFRRFPLVLTPSAWLNSFGANAPLLAMGALYSADAAGFFGLTLRVVALPATFIGAAVGNVYLSELARRHREGLGAELALFYRVTKYLLLAGSGFGLTLVFVAPSAFGLIFGHRWEPTGDMARAYAIAACAQLIASPVSSTLIVHERFYQQIFWDLARLLATTGSVLISWATGAEPLTAVWILSATATTLYVINWGMCRQSLLQNLGAR